MVKLRNLYIYTILHSFPHSSQVTKHIEIESRVREGI